MKASRTGTGLVLLPVFAILSLLACSAGSENQAGGSGGLGTSAGATASGNTGGGASSASGGGSGAIGGGSNGATVGAVSGGASGGLRIPDAGGTTGGFEGGQDCGIQKFDLERKPGEVLLVLDRSASMKDTPEGVTFEGGTLNKWQIIIPVIEKVITQTDATISWGLKTFPEGDGEECVAGSVTNKVDVPIAAMNAANVVAAIESTTPEGNGTPTGDAINAAVTYLQSLTETNPKYILLATDGEPSCAGTTKDSSTARSFAATAVTNAAAAGFHTFVVGVNTTKTSDENTLNQLAINGGEPVDDPNPLATKFYLANTQDDLVAALGKITADVSKNCIFPLMTAPPVKDNIRVEVAGTKIPRDDTDMNGWAYTDMSTVQVFGQWCDEIKGSGANQVNITYGCPNIDVR